MGNYKRCSVVFNLNNPMQSDLYDWCLENSTNFSDFARSIIFAYKQSQTSNPVTVVSNSRGLRPSLSSDINNMSEMF
jgi:hypothetical protein